MCFLNTSSSSTKLKNKILNPMSSFFQLAGNCSCPHVGVGEVISGEVGATLKIFVTDKLIFCY